MMLFSRSKRLVGNRFEYRGGKVLFSHQSELLEHVGGPPGLPSQLRRTAGTKT
jgi:hypothetical protein